MEIRILVVDDEDDSRSLIAGILVDSGYTVDSSATVQNAIKYLEENKYDIVVTDKNMPGLENNQEGGMDLLRYVKKEAIDTEVIMVTGYATIETAIEAMKLGAFDYFYKPFSIKDLREKIKRVLDYKSFINPINTINIYKTLHNEILDLIEKRDMLDDPDLHPYLKSIDAKIDHFFQAQKKWERAIIEQREALGKIAVYAEQLKEEIPPDSPLFNLVENISIETQKRL